MKPDCNPSTTTVCVMGLGYIGLPTAAVLAARGFEVRGVDINNQIIDTINQGRVHITEPDLDMLVRAAVSGGRLQASTTPGPADVFIIAVPTPFRDNHEPDLRFVEAATRAIAPHVQPGNLVILESTSPVGTTEAVARWIADARPDLPVPACRNQATASGDVLFAHCPERVLPGRILHELVSNDRVIGGINAASSERCAGVYRSFVAGKIHITDCRTAEMCKLTENAFRDVNIAFANELSLVCDRVGIDVWELIRLANHHPRVKILNPGPGVGGHCIAVDPWFIVSGAPDLTRLMRTARDVNDGKSSWVINQVARAAQQRPASRIIFLGVTYKPDIDDIRESPALLIAQRVHQDFGSRVIIADPHADTPFNAPHLHGIVIVGSVAIMPTDIVVILVAHTAFADTITSIPPEALVMDTCGATRGMPRPTMSPS